MPRQLPWLNKGSATKDHASVRPAPRPARRPPASVDDENFFAGTVFASSSIGKQPVDPESSDDLPGISTSALRQEQSKPRTIRAPSSSPPPAVDLPPLEIEYMHTAVDMFNLHDDEWMMVEDEFLQTAKLFTRHLHLAEYERLKKNIQTMEDAPRPIIANAKPSDEGRARLKARAQSEAQRKALREALSSNKGDFEDYLRPSSRPSARKSPYVLSPAPDAEARPPAPAKRVFLPTDPESDDLDAPNRSSKTIFTGPQTIFTGPLRTKSMPTTKSSVDPFPPADAMTAPSRPVRRTPFDLLGKSPKLSISPTKPDQALAIGSSSSPKSQSSRPRPSQRMSRPFDLLSELDFPSRDPLPKEQADRLAKRKAEREKEQDKEKRKSVKLDDIPTFLF